MTALSPADGGPRGVEVARLWRKPPPAGHEMQAKGDQMGANGAGEWWSGGHEGTGESKVCARYERIGVSISIFGVGK